MSTDDTPKRELYLYDSDGFPAATLENEVSSLNLSESEATLKQFKFKGKSGTKPKASSRSVVA